MNYYHYSHSLCMKYNPGMAIKAILTRLLVKGSWISLINHIQGYIKDSVQFRQGKTNNSSSFI